MISEYMKEFVAWDHVIDTDSYSEATYQRTMILGRLEAGHKLVRDRLGAEIVSSACIITAAAIVEGDLINGRLVVAVDPQTLLDGSFAWNEAYLL